MSKKTYEELNDEYNKFKTEIGTFFEDKIFTKIPFGVGKNTFLVEIMVSRNDYKRILTFNQFLDALNNAKEMSPDDAEKHQQIMLEEAKIKAEEHLKSIPNE